MKLSGVAAIVTGGGSGLGRATAEALAAKGARVAVFDLNPAAAEEAAKAVDGLALVGDVADEASAGAAIANAAAAHGPARVLVNCAGVGVAKRVVGRDGPQPLADFEKVIRVNLIGTFNVIRLVAAGMSALEPIDGERGVIISTASVAAYEGQIGQAAYSASKGGVVAMTLPIARELAQFGVRVNAIAPGIFLTPMLLGLPQPAQDSLGAPRCRFPRASASRPSTPRSPSTSSRTATSTARRSASTARCGWRRNREPTSLTGVVPGRMQPEGDLHANKRKQNACKRA
jgi:NAD(P)-dependent dehydrogenase (short-subunit alcohol dehydrogenase family)